MATAEAAGEHVILDVMEKDLSAIRLYRRLGFTELGGLLHAYGDSLGEPAIAMAAPRSILGR